MNHQYKVTLFRAEQPQKLRNVKLHSPSIIQIITGSKRLHWRDSALDVSHSELLLCEASASLSFENLPQGRFLSRMFSFYCLPSDAMIELSKSHAQRNPIPIVASNHALQDTLNALFLFDQHNMSKETQFYWVNGLYQQLAERGALHCLFTSVNTTFSQRLSRYLADAPSEEHSLDAVAQHFAISRSTMIRKLKQEGTQYRQVLVDVRLNHALHLMQDGQNNVAMLAQLCGYQSEGRFSQRFKGKFGLTPSDYIKTVVVQ
ncbi:helix-turn-helix transcriptional regulator [Vibrio spartinae]|uniref:HTH-type transcriptional regulator AppY n=1 Tax=Vibrio spartinae TaxID=1918945 RepID=A0A1N6M8F6_9VIBR|nr:AraC family transcriptional regulator [Vibrio spartinae]SIO95709.1 HTH-type transcriptional regulator AppY [Vibrio spartinae]